MTTEAIEKLFTRENGDFVFARWGRPLAPMVVGLSGETMPVVKGAIEAVAALAGQEIVETDPELGANCIFFFLREWSELSDVPNLDQVMGDLPALIDRLEAAGANQYRAFRFDDDGAILAAYVFLRMDKILLDIPAEELALSQMAQVILCWSDTAFLDQSPLAVAGETAVLRPELGDLIRAAYDPVLPAASRDRSHAMRLSARMEKLQ